MKRIVLAMVLFACIAPFAAAQNHGTFGVYADYLRLNNASTPTTIFNNGLDLVGVGGRAGFNIHPNVQLEGELSYDFERGRLTTTTTGGLTSVTRSNLRAFHGLFGPKFQTSGDRPWNVFLLTKGGFTRLMRTDAPVTAGGVGGVITSTDTNNMLGTFYVGGGVEAFAGWFGIRADIGDHIYFSDGAKNNLRVTVGPVIRF